MKKRKRILPMLAAVLILAAPGIRAEAESNYVEVKSGSTSAKIVFTVEEVLALEGTIYSEEKSGFEVSSIEISGTEEGSSIKTEGNQFVVIGNHIPADVKITANMESSSPMKDGSYKVTMSYGITRGSGAYSDGKEMSAKIYVGIEAEKESEEDAKKNTQTTSVTTSSDKTSTETDVTESSSTPVANRLSGSGLVDYSGLRAALDEAEALEGQAMNEDLLERLTDAMNKGYEALESDRQSVVDEAAEELNAILQEIQDANGSNLLRNGSGGLSLGKWLPIILGILALLLLLGLLAFLWWRKKKKASRDYDGAPMVDYEIGDDDNDEEV